MDLGNFLANAGRRRRIAGEWDCVTFPAAWMIANGWADPMEWWRGTYDSEEEGLAFVVDRGGMVALFDEAMTEAGVTRRDGDAQPGDIGVIHIGDDEAGAIYTGKRWAFVGNRGVAMASIDLDCVAAVWAVGNG